MYIVIFNDFFRVTYLVKYVSCCLKCHFSFKILLFLNALLFVFNHVVFNVACIDVIRSLKLIKYLGILY